MNATAQPDSWQDQADEPSVCIDGRIDPAAHDAYWQNMYWTESYFRRDCDYEDYAPAYCVGYIGFAQYGGDFDDAEKSLCANWLRIKGASRLTLEEALQAIRAAWVHAGQAAHRSAAVEVIQEEEAELDYALSSARAGQARQPAMAAA